MAAARRNFSQLVEPHVIRQYDTGFQDGTDNRKSVPFSVPLSYSAAAAPLLSENPETPNPHSRDVNYPEGFQAGLFRLSPSGKFKYPASTTVVL